MLSGAKHLQYLLETKQMPILGAVYPQRSERARDDSPESFSAASSGLNMTSQSAVNPAKAGIHSGWED
jgi:hypothetical protein